MTGLLGSIIVLGAAFFGSVHSADAQLMIDLKMKKRSYVAYEPIMVQVVVSNRSGKDVVLGGPNGSSWLTFAIEGHNTLLSPTAKNPVMKPYVLGRGQSIVKELMLNSAYPMADYGTYNIVASVYYPPTQNYYSSPKKKIDVTSASKIWSQEIGFTTSPDQPTEYRQYSLLSHRDQNTAEIYVRVRNQKGSKVHATYSLGNLLAAGEPQATVDSENYLHVLHMGDRNTYAHSVVAPDGILVSQDIYKQTPASRPSLVFDQKSGNVGVRGGVKDDQIAAQADPNRIRRASELPPGL